jgi:hypothetical protein
MYVFYEFHFDQKSFAIWFHSFLWFGKCRFSVFFAVDREKIIFFLQIICQGGANVHVDTVLKTPQFWLLFTTSTLLATGIIRLDQLTLQAGSTDTAGWIS